MTGLASTLYAPPPRCRTHDSGERPASTAAPAMAPAGPPLDPADPAFERHLEALRPRMKAVAHRVVRRPEVAEDVVQSAYEKALRGLAGFDGRARLSTWLHRIVVNEGLMWLRTEGRRRKRFASEHESGIDPDAHRDPDADPSRRLFETERLALLRTGLAALPAAERDVLERCALEGWSYDAYARRRGIGAAAAKSRAFRARRRLRDLIEAA